MARLLALLVGTGLILGSLIMAGASTASAKAYTHEGWYKTQADCQLAGQDWGGDPFICLDDPAHDPPWDLLVLLP